MRTHLLPSFIVSVLLTLSHSASALPTVSVDTDPATAGIQSSRAVMTNETFDVDIFVADVDPLSPLNGFQLELTFDPAVLTLVSAADGGFLLNPVMPIANDIDNALGSLLFSSITLGDVGASGDGVLTRLVFQSLAVGSSLLDLDNILLSAPMGIPIPLASAVDGSIRVPSPVAVSEPAVLTLLAPIFLLSLARRRTG